MTNQQWEERAKFWDDKLPELASALRTPSLQASLDDIEDYGWIRASSSVPDDNKYVLVTDGKSVWIGDYNSKMSDRYGKWSLVFNGAVPFDSTEIIAWTYMPDVPPELLTNKRQETI